MFSVSIQMKGKQDRWFVDECTGNMVKDIVKGLDMTRVVDIKIEES